MTCPNDFVAFILTNGRPDKVITYETLRRLGYTGPIRLVVDDLDKTKDDYIKRYGDEVIIFDKRAVAATFDQGDNFNDMRAIIYARNACFDIAKSLGFIYFIELDDDYKSFDWRFDGQFNYCHRKMNSSLDRIFGSLLSYFVSSGSNAVALAQGGDYIGGEKANICFGDGKVGLKRKCMNSFVCSTERRFQFVGRVNEDVNSYTRLASTGLLLFTTNQVGLEQLITQSNSGGMTEMYLDSGTYVKSFYSVMYMPSAVKVRTMGFTSRRMHHSVDWKSTVPLILSQEVKKYENTNTDQGSQAGNGTKTKGKRRRVDGGHT